MPKKVDSKLLTEEKIDLELYKAPQEGLIEGEVGMPNQDVAEPAGPQEPQFDQDLLSMIISMGVGELAAKHSLLQTGNSSAEVAI